MSLANNNGRLNSLSLKKRATAGLSIMFNIRYSELAELVQNPRDSVLVSELTA